MEAGGSSEAFLDRKRKHNAKGGSQIGLQVTLLPLQMKDAARAATWPAATAQDFARSEETLAKVQAIRLARAGQTTTPLYLGDVMRRVPEDPAVWPTVQANSAGNSSRSGDRKDELLLQGMMRENEESAFWAKVKSSDAGPDFAKLERSDTGLSLQTQMALQEPRPWAPPRAGDWRSGSSQLGSEDMRAGGAMLPEQMSQTAVGGPTTVGSSATMTGRAGSPNPAFPCWLQGYPGVWLYCAPGGSPKPRTKGKKSAS